MQKLLNDINSGEINDIDKLQNSINGAYALIWKCDDLKLASMFNELICVCVTYSCQDSLAFLKSL